MTGSEAKAETDGMPDMAAACVSAFAKPLSM